jgi:hypothetical protein
MPRATKQVVDKVERERLAKIKFTEIMHQEFPNSPGTADLVVRLVEPNQPSIEEEVRYIKQLQRTKPGPDDTPETIKWFDSMISEAWAYNRLRRALRYRNTKMPDMSFEHFEELAQTGSCIGLGIIGD